MSYFEQIVNYVLLTSVMDKKLAGCQNISKILKLFALHNWLFPYTGLCKLITEAICKP